MVFKKLLFSIISLFFISACATYKPQFKNKEEIPDFPSDKLIEKTFYLVGDAGYSSMGEMSKALTAFQTYLKTENISGNYTLFLGDNIYPSGMDPENHPRRKQSENRIDAQYKAVKDYQGPVIFIPGNHEWYNGGNIGVKRQEDYVKQKFQDEESFKPSNGCPMESIAISEDIQLIIIDTQWVLEDWNKNPTINEFCDIKTREKFLLNLETELDKNQNKTIVFAMHHPMFTNGTHGGYFALQKHLYPLQKKIPMPGLASLVVQIRSQGGVSVQDRFNELYNNFMNELQKLAKNNERIVFVSGHDHNLQYIEKNGLKQIVSGSGSKESYAAIGETGYFSTGMQGFAVLDVFKDGSSWVRYYVADDNLEPKLIFQKEVISAPKDIDISKYETVFRKDTIIPIFKQGSLREALFFKTYYGEKYKDVYSKPVKAEVALLDTLYGGLRVVRNLKQDGYEVLLLEDAKGDNYRMRAMGKKALNISRSLITEDNELQEIKEKKNKQPTIRGQARDFYTASHPYAVMAIPEMADAIDIFHSQSQLFYVPKQKGLGNYNENFGDQLYLISTDNLEADSKYRYTKDIETTDDILIKLRKTGDVFLEEENYIKSRLFDMLIGNWHKGSDHLQWVEFLNTENKTVLAPIPKHRDNAFSSFEGNILDLTSSLFSGTLENHVYDDELKDFKWFNEEAVILDRALLQRSGRAHWRFLAEEIQLKITDEVIDDAFRHIPEEVRDESLLQIIETLKRRKDNLLTIADTYYSYLSDLQTITGTDFDDIFEIDRLPDGKTRIRVFSTDNGTKADVLLDKTFLYKDTKEIWIYGLHGDDRFRVEGNQKNLIFLRLIGGHGVDSFDLKNGRRVKVYDSENEESIVEEKNGGNLRFTDVYDLNTYQYRKQIHSSKDFLTAIGYNPDDGFRAAVKASYRVDNFQRNPFSQKHSLSASYYATNSSINLVYDGEFANIQGNLNLGIGARFTTPNYTMNFFGYGNESENHQTEMGYSYNKLEVQHTSAYIALLRNSNFGSLFKLRAVFDSYKINALEDSYSFSLDDSESNYFASLEGVYQYRSFDDALNPTIGMLFDLNLGVTDNLKDTRKVLGFLNTRIGFFNSLVKNRKIILKTDIRYQQNFGRNYQFYQSAQLGGSNGLRGFREDRFSGKSSLAGSADIRYSLPTFKVGLIPIQLGIYGGGDIGRVWTPKENSARWHNSRGGGLWINGAGGLNANLSAFNSTEGTRVVFGLGFDF